MNFILILQLLSAIPFKQLSRKNLSLYRGSSRNFINNQILSNISIVINVIIAIYSAIMNKGLELLENLKQS